MRLSALLPLLALALQAQPAATLVLVHGKVWTGNPSAPEAEAVACLGSRIVAVGRDAAIQKWIGPGTKAIDLAGRRLVPGFNDAHVHFFYGGRDLSSVHLRDARSEDEFRRRIAAFAAKLPSGRWIAGGAWDHENWTPARLPTRQLVDSVTGDHPLLVTRLDGHMSLANGVTLKLAGITRKTDDPPGGTIVRDANGEAHRRAEGRRAGSGRARHAGAGRGRNRRCRPRRHALCQRARRHQRAGHVGGAGRAPRL